MVFPELSPAELSGMAEQAYARARWSRGRTLSLILLELAEDVSRDCVVSILGDCLRLEDSAGWLAPDCLLLIIESHRYTSDSLRLARRLTERLEVQRGGIAGGVEYHSSGTAMLESAQLALARTSSGETFCYSDDELRKEAEYRLQFEDELTCAVKSGQLVPYFQPIIDLPTGNIRGFEALVRWHHPHEGLLYPDRFLEIARELGLLADLDRFILQESLRQLQLWTSESSQHLRVNVNLSPHHFLVDGELERLVDIVDGHRDIVKMLRVDISEEVLRHEQGLASLYQLQGLKIGFHLDDFGVSFDSFRCLNSFPFDSLKVDRSLIAEMEEEVNAELIIAVLRIAQRMKIRTTAEGLVTHAQLEELRQLGCDEAQGFLFSPAISAEAATDFLKVGPRW